MLLGIAGDDIHFMIEILAFSLHAKNKAAGRFFYHVMYVFHGLKITNMTVLAT